MKRTRLSPVGPVTRRRSAALRSLRPLILKRADGRCEVPWCRMKTRLELHHVVKRSQGGTEAASNIVGLCPIHHKQTDAPYGSKERRRLIIVRRPGGGFDWGEFTKKQWVEEFTRLVLKGSRPAGAAKGA